MATTNSENDRRIDYVEFNVADVARARKFYGGAFGWSFRDFGPDYSEFSGGRRAHRQAGLRFPGRPPLPLRRSRRLPVGGMVGALGHRSITSASAAPSH